MARVIPVCDANKKKSGYVIDFRRDNARTVRLHGLNLKNYGWWFVYWDSEPTQEERTRYWDGVKKRRAVL